MEGVREEKIYQEYRYRTNFAMNTDKSFANLKEVSEAKMQLRELKFNNIEDYLQ